MTDKKKNEGWDGSGAYTGLYPTPKEGDKPLPYITRRPKRRRVGQLNDGEWMPGYGPDAKKKPK